MKRPSQERSSSLPGDPSPSARLGMTPGAGAPNVIKLGGSLLEDGQRRHAVLAEIAKRWHCGEQLVIVHGGGKHIDAELAKLGIAKKTHGGLRITDDQTLDEQFNLARNGSARLVVHAHDQQLGRMALVVDAERRDGPTSHKSTGS